MKQHIDILLTQPMVNDFEKANLSDAGQKVVGKLALFLLGATELGEV
jgi:hypothetical protein